MVSVDNQVDSPVGLHFGSATNPVQFHYTNNWSGGSYSFLQVDDMLRTYTYSSTPSCKERSGIGLDGFPFGPLSGIDVVDFPSDGPPEVNMTSIEADDHFTIYLMFIPIPSDQSFYAPLRKLEWYYRGQAVPDTNSPYGWSLVSGSSSGSTIGSDTDASDYPTWTNTTGYIIDHPFICPP